MYGPRGSIVSGDMPWVQQRIPENLNMETGISFSQKKRITISKGVAFLILLAFIGCVAATGFLVYYLTTSSAAIGPECPKGTDDTNPSTDNSMHDEFLTTQEATTEPPVTETVLPDRPKHIRLSKTVVPKEYKLKIVPFLEETNLTFSGDVEILLKVLEETSNITVNAIDLVIDEASIMVQNTNQHEFPVAKTSLNKELQVFILNFEHNLPVDEYIVRMKYTGSLNNAMQGFYRSSYRKNNQTRWIAATQFQPTDARRAFPCFDEPAFKASFTLTIGRPNYMSSISNMPKARSEPAQDIENYTWDFFEKSVPMSTYLVAFIVSDFKSQTSGFVSVWARDDAIGQTRYSLHVAPPILEFYKNFFEIPFPLPKMDMIALPDFSAGAMENWGLLTYRESNLLYEDGVSMRSNMQRISIVVAHELAHQWFGNLVTPSWWTDLWLNEGFASYLEYLGTNAVNPEWKVLDQFLINELQLVFRLDALKSSHPISIEVNNPDEINDIFDRISYGKGATIIRMMDNILGTEVFRKGLTRFLKEKEYGSAQQDDLWEALTTQAHADGGLNTTMTVKEIMDTWTLQMGFPLLTVERNYETKTIALKQERFFLDKKYSNSSSKWWIPITYSDSKNVLNKKWMRNDQETMELSTDTEAQSWLLFNLNQTGYYRVNYDKKNWELIIAQLKSDHTKFDPKNRAQILDDALNLASAGYLDYKTAMDVTTYLVKELDYVPWTAAFRSLDFLHSMFMRTGHFDLFKNYMLELLTPLYKKLGFRDSTSDPLLTTYIKSEMLVRICRLNYRDCVNNANLKFKNWQVSIDPNSENPIEANLKGTVYCTAVRIGGEIEWNFLWERYLGTNVGTEKEIIQAALACTKETWLLNKYLTMAVTEGSGIRKQDAPSVFSAVSSNIVGQPLAYRFLTTNWDSIRKYMGSSFLSLNGMMRSVSINFNTEQEVQNLKQFAKLKSRDLASSMRPVNQAIESAEANIEWMQKHFESIKAWLADRKTE